MAVHHPLGFKDGTPWKVLVITKKWRQTKILKQTIPKTIPLESSIPLSSHPSGPLVDLDGAITTVVILLQQLIRLRQKDGWVSD